MARATGARATMALAFETTYGTAPAASGNNNPYSRIPFASTTLGAEQPLIASELLGYGRDPLPPVRDVITADGDVVVPIDVEAFGFWLKAAFGAPVTAPKSGSNPRRHTFKSGSLDLPSFSIETGLPDVPVFAMYSGCKLDSLSWQMGRSGLLTATASIIAQGEETRNTTQAGTPTPIAVKRFGHFAGTIKRVDGNDSEDIANVISVDINYTNNLDRVETIRADGKIDGADPGVAALTGNITVRFADVALLNQAKGGNPLNLSFSYSLEGNKSLTVNVPAAYLPVPRREISGPGGVQVTFDWQAARGAAEMVNVVLENDRASY